MVALAILRRGRQRGVCNSPLLGAYRLNPSGDSLVEAMRKKNIQVQSLASETVREALS